MRHDLGEIGAQQPGIGSGKEQRNSQTLRRELIAVAMDNALDDAMQPETAKVIGHPSDGVVGWIEENNHPYFFVLNIESPNPDFDIGTVRRKMLNDILGYLGFFKGNM